MRAYAETDRCRMAFLVGYFGERLEHPCGRCDRCSAGAAAGVTPAGDFLVGTSVQHRTFGAGTVTDTDTDQLTVLFDEHGYRTLALGVLAVVVGETLFAVAHSLPVAVVGRALVGVGDAVTFVCGFFRRLAVALLMCSRLFSPVGALTISARAGAATAVAAASAQADVRAAMARLDI